MIPASIVFGAFLLLWLIQKALQRIHERAERRELTLSAHAFQGKDVFQLTEEDDREYGSR